MDKSAGRRGKAGVWLWKGCGRERTLIPREQWPGCQASQHGAVVRVGAARRVNVASFQHIPKLIAGVDEDVVQSVAAVAPLGGAFPVVTVALAFVFFHERPAPNQWLGTALVIAGIVLMA